MSDLTPEERAARIEIDFTIGPERTARLRARIAHEIRCAVKHERDCRATFDATQLPVRSMADGRMGVVVPAEPPQDRTRAIVEAAEKLAKEIELRWSPSGTAHVFERIGHGPALDYRISDFLEALARALALPESEAKPVRDEARRDAIVRAAEEFIGARAKLAVAVAKATDDEESNAKIPDYSAFKVSEAERALARVVAAPAPKWTREPPSEPGYYWCRDSAKLPLFVHVQREELPGEYLEGGPPVSQVRSLFPNFEWWPIAIEPPKETP